MVCRTSCGFIPLNIWLFMDYIIRLIILAYGIYSLVQSGSQEMLEMIISIYPIVSDNMFINITYIYIYILTYGYMVIQLFGHMLSDNISNSLKHGNMLMMISGLCDGYDNGL